MHQVRFAAAYGFLGVIVIAAIALALLDFTLATKPHLTAHQVNGTNDAALIAQAETFVAENASQNGVTVTAQRLVSVVHKTSNKALVTLNVDAAGAQHFKVIVTMLKGVFSPIGLAIQPTP